MKEDIERLNDYVDFYEKLSDKQNKEIKRLHNVIEQKDNIIRELETYIEKMSYASVIDNPKKDLVKILKRVDKNEYR